MADDTVTAAQAQAEDKANEAQANQMCQGRIQGRGGQVSQGGQQQQTQLRQGPPMETAGTGNYNTGHYCPLTSHFQKYCQSCKVAGATQVDKFGVPYAKTSSVQSQREGANAPQYFVPKNNLAPLNCVSQNFAAQNGAQNYAAQNVAAQNFAAQNSAQNFAAQKFPAQNGVQSFAAQKLATQNVGAQNFAAQNCAQNFAASEQFPQKNYRMVPNYRPPNGNQPGDFLLPVFRD